VRLPHICWSISLRGVACSAARGRSGPKSINWRRRRLQREGKSGLPEVAQLAVLQPTVAQQMVAQWAVAAEAAKMETPWSSRGPSSCGETLQAPPLRSPSHPTAAVEQGLLADVVAHSRCPGRREAAPGR